MGTQKINKIIHYCWFGNKPKTELMLKCIQSWKNILPDWEINEWNDSNISEIESPYLSAAIKAKKWAFASDYVRLWALYSQGGVYFDVDVEAMKPFDDLCSNGFFIGIEQCTKKPSVGCGIIGSEKNHVVLKDMMKIYDNIDFIKPNGRCNLTPMPKRFADYFKSKYGLKLKRDNDEIISLKDDIKIYPYKYFSPKDNNDEVYAIHYFADSWLEDWGVRTWLNTKNFRLHIFKRHNPCAKVLPILPSEELIIYFKLSNRKSLALVKKIKNKGTSESSDEIINTPKVEND